MGAKYGPPTGWSWNTTSSYWRWARIRLYRPFPGATDHIATCIAPSKTSKLFEPAPRELVWAQLSAADYWAWRPPRRCATWDSRQMWLSLLRGSWRCRLMKVAAECSAARSKHWVSVFTPGRTRRALRLERAAPATAWASVMEARS